MGKKKKKKNDNKHYVQGYDQKVLDRIADSLEEYINLFDQFIIRDGTDEKEYKKAMKIIRKAIKNLREGNGDEVFDSERYQEMMERMENNVGYRDEC
jgi:uncharacterized protein YheU (UPF0270 family)